MPDGRLFTDIVAFHEKFGLRPPVSGHRLPDDVVKFRIKFMLEEVLEYADAMGYSVSVDPGPERKVSIELFDLEADLENAFDALIDSAYVVLGTAYLQEFPFDAGWDRVHSANMLKERAASASDPRSKRAHQADVVKPKGWKPPVLSDLLKKG